MGGTSSVSAERGGDERDDVAVTHPAEATRAADSSDSGSGASWAPPRGAAADVADAADEGRFEWPFESLAEAAEWWYRPVIEARSWLALAYLFVGAIWAPFAFVVALTAMVIVFGLSLVGVGLLLIFPLFGLINSFATLERRRTGWIGEAITSRGFHEHGSGYWGATRARLADSTRWRQVAFIAASLVVCPALFALGAMPWVIVVQLATGGGFGVTAALGGLLIAAIGVGGAPRATIFVAGVARSYVAWFLGPDQNAELAERVEQLAARSVPRAD